MKRYGLIGKSLQHSYSQSFFSQKFSRENTTDTAYHLFEIPSIDRWPEWIEAQQKHPDGPPLGLNVTLPYKRSIMPYLNGFTDTALAIGAVNAIRQEDKKWIGHNTDVDGFAKSLRPFLTSDHERALILGNGGAAAAVRYVLQGLGVEVVHITREPLAEWRSIRYDELSAEAVTFFGLVIQATPVGTYPDITDYLPFPFEGIGSKHLVIDLIYNPSETAFMKQCKDHGATVLNGKDMLFAQAEAAWLWWNS